MSKWTEEELNALDAVAEETGMAAYHVFGTLTNYSKSFNAFEVKRRRVTQSSPARRDAVELTRSEYIPAQIFADPKDFVGLSIGYWDLETTFSTQPIVLFGAIADQFGEVEQFRKGRDITDDKDLVHSIALALSDYDVWVTWNGKLFDVPVLNGRLRYHGLQPLTLNKHIDAMYYAMGGQMRIGRRSLQSVSEYFDTDARKTPLSVRIWDRAMSGDEEAYELIIEHCIADTLTLRQVFDRVKPMIANIHR